MTTSAIVLMVLTMGVITAFTVYFFVRILKAPPPADDGGDDGKSS